MARRLVLECVSAAITVERWWGKRKSVLFFFFGGVRESTAQFTRIKFNHLHRQHCTTVQLLSLKGRKLLWCTKTSDCNRWCWWWWWPSLSAQAIFSLLVFSFIVSFPDRPIIDSILHSSNSTIEMQHRRTPRIGRQDESECREQAEAEKKKTDTHQGVIPNGFEKTGRRRIQRNTARQMITSSFFFSLKERSAHACNFFLLTEQSAAECAQEKKKTSLSIQRRFGQKSS